MKIGIDTPSAMMQAYFAQHAGLNEGFEVFVDCRKRDRRQVLFYLLVDLFWRIMPGTRHHSFKDSLPLMGRRQVVLAAQVAELVISFPAHIYQMIKIIKRFRLSSA